ncbi:MAG: DUF2752 domain-containing protein [Flavobacteriaceae bacterium]
MLTKLFILALDLEQYMLPCMTKKWLGIDCPGCGLQRSVAHLIKGEFVEAFFMYPAIYPMLLLFSFMVIKRFFSLQYENAITIGLSIATVFAILANYLLKFIY